MSRVAPLVLLGFVHAEGGHIGGSVVGLKESTRSLQYGEAGYYDGGAMDAASAYEEFPADTSYAPNYAASAQKIIPYQVDLRLGCNCALHIPCYDLKTSDCVPTVCGYNGHVEFQDHTLPRYGHPASNYDDDAGINGNFTTTTSKKHGRVLTKNNDASQYSSLDAGYSNPVINGCKCPSGTTRCYGCAEVNTGAKVWMWILVFVFLFTAACIATFTFSNDSAPTKHNQFALGVAMSMTGILCLAALSHMCVALDTGYLVRRWDLRRVYYARYFDWLVSTGVMMYTLSYIGAGGPYHTVLLIVLDAAMIIMGFVGALIEGNIKWLFFIVGFFAYVWFSVILLTQLKGSSDAPQMMPIYFVLKWVVVILFLLYPIVWLESEGIGNFCAGTEAILYGILDLVIKLTFCSIVGIGQAAFIKNPPY